MFLLRFPVTITADETVTSRSSLKQKVFKRQLYSHTCIIHTSRRRMSRRGSIFWSPGSLHRTVTFKQMKAVCAPRPNVRLVKEINM